MSSIVELGATPLLSPVTTFVIFTSVVIYLSALKVCFGTYWLPTAVKQERGRQELEDVYNRAHSRREEAVYQITWARQRGEGFETIRSMEEQLSDIDLELDGIEREITAMYNDQGVGRKIEKES